MTKIEYLRSIVDKGSFGMVKGGNVPCKKKEVVKVLDEYERDQLPYEEDRGTPKDYTVVDMQTANVILKVHSLLSPDRQKKLESFSIEKMAKVCWSLV